MSKEEEEQREEARIDLLNLFGQSNSSNAWKLFRLLTPTLTKEQVKEWMNLLETENVAVSDTYRDDKEVVPGLHTLTNVPRHLIEQIVDSVDTQSEKNLRLTCRSLVEFVDAKESLVGLVHIHLSLHKVEIHIKQIKKTPQRITCNDTMSPQNDHIGEAVEKFGEIFSKAHVKVKKLKIDWEENHENLAEYSQLLERMSICIAGFGREVHVEELDVQIISVEHLEHLLRSMKPNALKELFVDGYSKNIQDVFDFANIVTLPHWKKLKSFNSNDRIMLSCPMHHFVHILTVRIRIESPPPTEILNYKNKMIASSQNCWHSIWTVYNLQNTKTLLIPHQDCSGLTETGGYFIRPNGERLNFVLYESLMLFTT